MSVVVGGRPADGGGGGAAGAGLRRRHGGRLQGAAVEGTRLERAAGGTVALGRGGGGRLRDTKVRSDEVNLKTWYNLKLVWFALKYGKQDVLWLYIKISLIAGHFVNKLRVTYHGTQ